jgi:putative endonuclease
MCSDGDWYIGSTDDFKRRIVEHNQGKCETTKYRLPIELVYFEACRSLKAAREREQQLKSGFGRGYLNRRLEFELDRFPARHNA